MRGEGRLRAAGRYIVSGGSAGSVDEFQIVQIIRAFTAKVARTSLQCIFFYFFIPLSSKTPSFESFLEDCLPEMLSKLGVLAETSMKKSRKKTSQDSSGGTGRLWKSGSALGCSGGALGGPGRALGGSTYRKTPDKPPQRLSC